MRKIKIGTRKSALAMFQTHFAIQRIIQYNPALSADDFEIIGIVTRGDQNLDKTLREIGGKELFTKEIEQALIDGKIDMAVHSMKDVEASYPEELEFCCILPRGNPFDVLVSKDYKSLSQLPKNAIVGTSSLRRELFVKHLRSDLQIKPIRGNIQTRLQKIEDGEYDAIILAAAAVDRLNIERTFYEYIPKSIMIPAPCQGSIGVQSRKSDYYIKQILSNSNHQDSFIQVKAERGFVEYINGNCHTPLAVFSKLDANSLEIDAMLANEDFSTILFDKIQGSTDHAFQLGQELAERMESGL